MLPVKNPRVSQEYGRVNPKYKKGYHSGIDLVADKSDNGIYSIGKGKVIVSRYTAGSKGADPTGWGNYVVVRQEDGKDILYAHLFQVYVKTGQVIEAGKGIGIQGSTGNTTGPHLHLEIFEGSWENRKEINPAEYLGIKNAVGPVEFIRQKEKFFEEVEVTVNGITLKGYIPKYEDRAYIQVRELAEAFNAKLDWDGEKRKATLDIFSQDELKAKMHTAKLKLEEAINILN